MLKWNNEPTLEKQWYINWKSSWEKKHKHPWLKLIHVKSPQESVQIEFWMSEFLEKNSGSSQPLQVCTRVAYLRAQPLQHSTAQPFNATSTRMKRWSDAKYPDYPFTHFTPMQSHRCSHFIFLSSLHGCDRNRTERYWKALAKRCHCHEVAFCWCWQDGLRSSCVQMIRMHLISFNALYYIHTPMQRQYGTRSTPW